MFLWEWNLKISMGNLRMPFVLLLLLMLVLFVVLMIKSCKISFKEDIGQTIQNCKSEMIMTQKIRMLQLNSFCCQNARKEGNAKRNEVSQHILVCHKRKITWCYLPKVRLYFIVSLSLLPPFTKNFWGLFLTMPKFPIIWNDFEYVA